MIQEGLRVAVPLKDKTLGVVTVDVLLVLQSPGVFSAHEPSFWSAVTCHRFGLRRLAAGA